MKKTVTAALVVLVVAGGCGQPNAPAADKVPTPERNDSSEVEIAPENLQSGRVAVETLSSVQYVPRRLLVSGTVTVMPSGTSVLSAPTDARVTRVEVIPGDRVEAGQVLARLEASAVASARAGLRRSEALAARARSLVEQEGQLELLHATSKRDSTLARQELEVARAEQAAAEGNLRAWGTSRRGGPDVVLRAPFSGVVTHVDVSAGSNVPGASVLLRLLAPRALSVMANVPQGWENAIAFGPAELSTGVGNNDKCAAVVRGHLYRVDPGSGTVPFRLEPAEECRSQLLEGAMLEVALPLMPKPGDSTLSSVGSSALTTIEEHPALFVQTGAERFEVNRVQDLEVWEDREYFRWQGPTDARVATRGVLLLKGELARGELE